MKKYITTSIMIASIGLWIYQGLFLNDEEIILPEAMQYQDFIDSEDYNFIELVLAEEDIVTSTEDGDVDTNLVLVENDEKILGEKIIYNSINLAVPFSSQAPTGNWEQPWQDACEEASVLMIDYYYRNETIPNKLKLEQDLFDMVSWQEKNWQGHFNLAIADLAEYVDNNYTYNFELIDDLDLVKIKSYLDKGLPIIVPADGKKLDNPYFSNGGPEYHMLVIKGYLEEEGKFITNDPGTRRGEDFLYTYENMLESIADWDKKRSSATGSKRGLVLYKN